MSAPLPNLPADPRERLTHALAAVSEACELLEGAVAGVAGGQDVIARNVELVGGCWIWTAEFDSKGYPRFPSLAHRVSYELHHGEIPEGARVVQTCGDRGCVNPEHLEALTVSEANSRARKAA